jgi:hypothetical protein
MEKKVLRILADDPATVNYGRVLLLVRQCSNSRLKFSIKRAWLVSKTIRSETVKTDIFKVLGEYSRVMERVELKYRPIHVYCAERFMPRSGMLVGHGEAIAMMLALNVRALPNTVSKLIPAVSWKTQIKRYFDLKELYKEIKPCPEHLLDAIFIGLYSAYVHFGIKPYSTLRLTDIDKIVERLQAIGDRIKIEEDKKKRSPIAKLRKLRKSREKKRARK